MALKPLKPSKQKRKGTGTPGSTFARSQAGHRQHDALIPAWKAAKAAGNTDAMRALVPQIEAARAGVIAAGRCGRH